MGIAKFRDAYAAFYRSVAANSWLRARQIGYIAEQESSLSVLGSYLYFFHSESYSWSFERGAPFGLPLRHTCFAFRIATHLHDLKWPAIEGIAGAVTVYESVAREIIVSGVRKEPQVQQRLLSPDNSTDHMWTVDAAQHCVNRTLPRALEAYFRLPTY